ncbi:hypothetical protein Scep_002001 [Stephania cephalantha]|uniref:Uncharacterized protein n=1 Tax=Stephania cephalantha TaxID=152367 RepID=A0AAP0Q4A4_9MAGN
MHREREREAEEPASPCGVLRERVRVPGGGGGGGGGEGVGTGVRGGEGEEGEGGGDGGVREVGGGYDGGEGEASLRGGEDVLGVGRDQGGVRGGGFWVGEGGVRWSGEGRGGDDRRCSSLRWKPSSSTFALCRRWLCNPRRCSPLFVAVKSRQCAAKMANEIHLGPDELARIPCSPLMNVAIEQIVLQRGGLGPKWSNGSHSAVHMMCDHMYHRDYPDCRLS